jgi:soluble lytic murein transglycosylase-like protein
VGTDATRPQVRNALTTAARTEYWTATKGITVPPALVKAIAWQKTRWQSSIVSCDGTTVGIMQVSPKTAGWLNQRFTAEYDLHTLAGNAALGAEYLQWLVKHYGDTAFATSAHPYDVLHNPRMLDMVIGAYSAGTAEIDAKGAAGIPNPEFVAQVKELMTSCPCLSY